MLLEKFEFIPPDNLSGYLPLEGSVKVIKKNQYRYVNLGTIIGDAPKCMVALYDFEKDGGVRRANSHTWRKYIAKSARKWYPNESITEHLLNELGRTIGLDMANSCIRRVNKHIWFFSEYFLNEEQQLSHGADLYALYLNGDIDFVHAIQDDNKIDDQNFFNIQLVQKIFLKYYPADHSTLFESFIKMLIFDGLVGNNDRHAYNWGLIQGVKVNESVRFAPVYDTARGLYWNISESSVSKILSYTDKTGFNKKIDDYVLNSRPKIGWEGENSLSHIDLLKQIYLHETGISKENFVNLISQDNLNKCLNVINEDFKRLLTENRRKLMSKCLTLRFQKLNDFI
jgi:ribosomal protein L28